MALPSAALTAVRRSAGNSVSDSIGPSPTAEAIFKTPFPWLVLRLSPLLSDLLSLLLLRCFSLLLRLERLFPLRNDLKWKGITFLLIDHAISLLFFPSDYLS